MTNEQVQRVVPLSSAVAQVALVSLIMLMHNSVMLPAAPTFDVNVSVFISGLLYVPIAVIAHHRPRLLSLAFCSSTALFCSFLGALLWDVVLTRPYDATLFLIADTLLNAGRAWGTLLAALALSRIPSGERSMIGALAGIACSYALWPLLEASAAAAPVIFASLFLGLLIVIGSLQQRDLFALINTTESPRELASTNPYSFVPLSSKLFVCIALFETTFGYATSVRFGSIASWQYALIAIIFGTLIALWSRARRHVFDEDAAFRLSTLVVVTGFLLTPATSISRDITSTVIECGSQCFYALMFSILASVARRNPAGALATIPLGFAVSSCCSVVGFSIAQAGIDMQAAGVPDALLILSAAMALALFCFVWIGLGDFRFVKFFGEIVPAEAPERPSEQAKPDTPDFDTTIDTLADTHGLTAREREIAGLLARGHSGRSIEERLIISNNTVKTHTRHIYKKLNVHSQQELIDLVEHLVKG